MKLLFLLGALMLVVAFAQRPYMYRRPPRLYLLGGYPGYMGRWVGRYGGAGAGPMFADGEGPPGTREYHASHGHFHPH
jgi:hypothetical protein